MHRFIAIVLVLLTGAILTSGNSSGTMDDSDTKGIRQAVLNYANSAYLVKPELVERSVHPKLQKIGYVKRKGDDHYRELWMNFYELKELVSGWNKDKRFDPQTARRDIKILDQLDQTAVARLDAEWGIDFFQLAKIDGEWKIMNVVWQSEPPQQDETSGSHP